jgi:hypothetical protein
MITVWETFFSLISPFWLVASKLYFPSLASGKIFLLANDLMQIFYFIPVRNRTPYLSIFYQFYIILSQWKKPPLAKRERREKIWRVRLNKNSTIRRPDIVRRVPIILHSSLSTNCKMILNPNFLWKDTSYNNIWILLLFYKGQIEHLLNIVLCKEK